MKDLTKEDVEKWYVISQFAAGLTTDVFKPKEVQIIQDFIETAKSDLLKQVKKNESQD